MWKLEGKSHLWNGLSALAYESISSWGTFFVKKVQKLLGRILDHGSITRLIVKFRDPIAQAKEEMKTKYQ
jgi:hypothetical protein